MRLVKQTILYFKEGNSDKTYEIDLCEVGNDKYVVNFRYGRTGSQLKEGSKTPVPVSLHDAQKLFDVVETEKIQKGYTTNTDGISIIPAKSRFTIDNLPPLSVGWQSGPADRNKAILQRLHNAVTNQPTKVRAKWNLSRVIWKAGEYKINDAAPYIIHLFNKQEAMHQYSCCWALGRCGNKTAISALQHIFLSSPTQSLSRLAGIGLLNLLEGTERDQHVGHYFNSLPEEFKSAINSQQPTKIQQLVVDRINQTQISYSWLENLYLVSLDKKWLRPVLKQTIRYLELKAGYFKHIRAIYKWGELLSDFEIIGMLSCRFEREPHQYTHYLSSAQRKSVKNYIPALQDFVTLLTEQAKKNTKLAYSNKTRWYFHKRTLLQLTSLGKTGNSDYVKLATALLISYNKEQDQKDAYSEHNYIWKNNKYESIELKFPANAQAVYLHRIINGDNQELQQVSGHRFQLVDRSRKRKNKLPGEQLSVLKFISRLFKRKNQNENKAGIESTVHVPDPVPSVPFQQLWNKLPQAYVQLLMEAELDDIHQFAKAQLENHPSYSEILAKLDLQTCIKLVGSPFRIPAEFGFTLVETNYSQATKEISLVLAMLGSRHQKTRETARRWVELNSLHFLGDGGFIASLLFAQQDDIRSWGHNFLKNQFLSVSVKELVIGKAVASLLAYHDKNASAALILKEGTDSLFLLCSTELENLDSQVVADLLQHPVPEILLFGLRLVRSQENRLNTDQFPLEFIASLLYHHYEPVRIEGVSILNRLSIPALQKRSDLVLHACISEYADLRKSITPILSKLVAADQSFGNKAASELMPYLMRKEKNEGFHSDISALLCNQLSDYLLNANKETALNLLYSNYSAAQDVGILILEKYTEPSQLTIPQIVAMGSHENRNVREWCWNFYEKDPARIKYEKESAVRLLDSKWEDTRQYARQFFREKMEEKDWDADLLIALADSTNHETESFARELITNYFQHESGDIYLSKLSQHPREKMQLFVTNYLERYAADDLLKIKRLEFYFRSVLTRVNKGRIAKSRILRFLSTEGLKSAAAAELVSGIISDMSATAAIEDKARCIEILSRLKSVYAIETPLEIIPITEKAG